MSFDSVLSTLLQWEGVYDMDPDDSGGETCYGITRKYQTDWIGWPVVEMLKAAHIQPQDWHSNAKLMASVRLYYAAAWKTHNMDTLPENLQGVVFGGVVNQGPVRVVRWLQESLRELHQPVDVDGQIGEQVAGALCKVESQLVLEKVWNKRVKAYIVSANKGRQGKYLLGWLNRISGGG